MLINTITGFSVLISMVLLGYAAFWLLPQAQRKAPIAQRTLAWVRLVTLAIASAAFLAFSMQVTGEVSRRETAFSIANIDDARPRLEPPAALQGWDLELMHEQLSAFRPARSASKEPVTCAAEQLFGSLLWGKMDFASYQGVVDSPFAKFYAQRCEVRAYWESRQDFNRRDAREKLTFATGASNRVAQFLAPSHLWEDPRLSKYLSASNDFTTKEN